MVGAHLTATTVLGDIQAEAISIRQRTDSQIRIDSSNSARPDTYHRLQCHEDDLQQALSQNGVLR